MPTEPYIATKPGDLITAENMNKMQILIREDIPKQITTSIDKIVTVPKSIDTTKLDGQSLEEITRRIVEQSIAELNKKTGYRRVFRRLKAESELVVAHGLGDAPLTDVYQLEYFPAISSEDGIKRKQPLLFFLYHTSEKTISTKVDADLIEPTIALTTIRKAEIEPSSGSAFRISWATLLDLYKVDFNDESTLDDLESNFWDKFSAANESFDDEQTAHSPWFDRCCGEKRTVRDLKNNGSWKDLWLKLQPEKTINLQGEANLQRPMVQVRHFDLNQTGFQALLLKPPLANGAINPDPLAKGEFAKELPVMILQKV